MNPSKPKTEGLFIRGLERRPRTVRAWRLLRWLSVGLLPLTGECVMRLEEILRGLGLDLDCILGGGCATTLAIGEEGGI